ncbi:MAG: hypothetical protein M3R30_02685 [Candidatus Eremiobacteraeota bacterium]|nr:hypothetical protein [Candidatus Eremiobacteraeota bacterium]
MKYPADLATLFARARELFVRRSWLYVACTAVALAAQTALLLTHRIDQNVALIVGEVFALAPLSAIVYAFGANDDAGATTAGRSVWGSILERIWVVVFIDAALGLLSFGLRAGVGSSEIAQTISQVGVLILATMLAFSEAHAIVAPEQKPGQLLVESLLASVRITTTRVGYARAVGVVFVPVLLISMASGSLWGFVLASTLLQAPVAMLTLIFYQDCQALARANIGK